MSGMLYLRKRKAFDVLVDGDVIGYIRETCYGSNEWEVFTVEGARCAETTSGPADAARLIQDIHKAVTA